MKKFEKLSEICSKFNIALIYTFGSQKDNYEMQILRKYSDVKYLFDRYFEEALEGY
ncbi:hypothetical protein [Thermodesulfovibrio sp. TK110]